MNERQMKRKVEMRRKRKRLGMTVIAVTVVGVGLSYVVMNMVRADSFVPWTSAANNPGSSATTHLFNTSSNSTQPIANTTQQTTNTVANNPAPTQQSAGPINSPSSTAPANHAEQAVSSVNNQTGITVTFTTAPASTLASSPNQPNQPNASASPSGPSPTPANSQGSTGSVPVQLPAKIILSVPAQDQLPQLPNGCEVTSLSMLFTAIGHPVNKTVLADEEPTDPTQLKLGPQHQIEYWGNPNVGFVGNVRGYGYGIYHGPIVKLINKILPGHALDLTGQPFSNILTKVAEGLPVMVWTTSNFQPEPPSQWITWNSPEGPVHATMWEHAVLVVGYDAHHIYINDPLDGTAAKAVDRSDFIAAWNQLGQQAVTILPATTTDQ